MNQRTSRLLKKYALKNGQNPRQLKREWQGLPAAEKASKRRAYLKALGAGAAKSE